MGSNLCENGAYMHIKGAITVPNTAAQGTNPNNKNKKRIFKNCAKSN